MRLGLRSLALTQRRTSGGGGGPVPTVTLETTFTKTASLTQNFSFPYAASHGIGALLVLVATGRSVSAIVWNTTITDDAGNTYTKRVEGTQSNGLTDTAIYDCVLTAAVTSANSITVGGNAVTYASAQHATLFTMTGVTGYDSSAQAPTTASATVTNSVTTGGPFTGVALHASSGGGSPGAIVNSVSGGWTNQSSLRVNGCSQYTATKPSNAWADPVSNSYGMDTSANYAGVIAYYA